MKEKLLLVLLGGLLAFGMMYLFYAPAQAAPTQMTALSGRYVFQPAQVSAYVLSSEEYLEVNTVVRADCVTGEVWVLQAQSKSLIDPNFVSVSWKKVAERPPVPADPDSISALTEGGFGN